MVSRSSGARWTRSRSICCIGVVHACSWKRRVRLARWLPALTYVSAHTGGGTPGGGDSMRARITTCSQSGSSEPSDFAVEAVEAAAFALDWWVKGLLVLVYQGSRLCAP